jgi:hypothetical protein
LLLRPNLGCLKQAVVNVEEKIDCWVGRRTQVLNGLATATSDRAKSVAWLKRFGGIRVSRD